MRSQMAEAFFNAMPPPGWRAGSAGTAPAIQIMPQTYEVMRELGFDLEGQYPKSLDEALTPDVALVIGLCAEEACPVIPGVPNEHWPLPDPVGRDLNFVRGIRDDLRARVTELVKRLPPFDRLRANGGSG
ncbi:MAG: arsenate reductase ArsC [bacterium]